jgi:hypothetical protein
MKLPQGNIYPYGVMFTPLTPNDLQRRHAVSPLKIKIPSKKILAGSIVQRDLIPALTPSVVGL